MLLRSDYEAVAMIQDASSRSRSSHVEITFLRLSVQICQIPPTVHVCLGIVCSGSSRNAIIRARVRSNIFLASVHPKGLMTLSSMLNVTRNKAAGYRPPNKSCTRAREKSLDA